MLCLKFEGADSGGGQGEVQVRIRQRDVFVGQEIRESAGEVQLPHAEIQVDRLLVLGVEVGHEQKIRLVAEAAETQRRQDGIMVGIDKVNIATVGECLVAAQQRVHLRDEGHVVVFAVYGARW